MAITPAVNPETTNNSGGATNNTKDTSGPNKPLTKLANAVTNMGKVEVLPESSPGKSGISFSVVDKQEDTRGRLAQYYILGFFICIIGVSILALLSKPADGKTAIDNLKDSIILVSGVLSGPLGFVIGFYFRKSDQ
jgi:hypothetical protein